MPKSVKKRGTCFHMFALGVRHLNKNQRELESERERERENILTECDITQTTGLGTALGESGKEGRGQEEEEGT